MDSDERLGEYLAARAEVEYWNHRIAGEIVLLGNVLDARGEGELRRDLVESLGLLQDEQRLIQQQLYVVDMAIQASSA